ncbi:MAG: hypothetical protein WBL84_13250 [Xanthobacteraceae bacterium]
MSPRPGRVEKIFDIDLPRPRSLEIRDEAEFIEYSRTIRGMFEEVGVFKAKNQGP